MTGPLKGEITFRRQLPRRGVSIEASRTDVEHGVQVVVLGFSNLGLLKEPKDGSVAQCRFVDLYLVNPRWHVFYCRNLRKGRY